MKSYTDIDQSKKLAKVLQIETADMCYYIWKDDGHLMSLVPFVLDGTEEKENGMFEYIPCWSFTALFKLLPKSAQLEKGNVTELYRVILPVELETSDWYIDPVDACVVMIERLYELNLL